jgi:hypothetical protein
MILLNKINDLLNDEKLPKKAFLLSLSALVFVFTIYVVFLSYITRPVADDFAFYAIVKAHGFAGSVKVWYYTFQGRFTQQYITGLLAYYYVNNYWIFFIYNLILTFAFGEAIFALIGKLLHEIDGKMSVLHQRLLAYFFIFSFLFFNGQSNVYFWLTCNQIYFLSLVTSLWGFVFLLKAKMSWLDVLGALCCFFYVSGANEAFTAICFVFLVLLFVVTFIQKARNNRKIIVISLILVINLIGLYILLGAPGNAFRQESLPVPKSLLDATKLSFTLIPFLWDVIKGKVLYGILFSFCFIPLGALVNFPNKEKYENVLKILLISFLPVLFLSFWGILFIMSVGTGTTQALRAYTVSFFFVYTHLFLIFFFIGAMTDFGQKYGYWLGLKWCLICLLFFSARLVSHVPKGLSYAKAFDARFEKIWELKAKGQKDTVEFDKYPHLPDFIHALEISEDANYKYNQQLVNELALGFQIKLKKEK